MTEVLTKEDLIEILDARFVAERSVTKETIEQALVAERAVTKKSIRQALLDERSATRQVLQQELASIQAAVTRIDQRSDNDAKDSLKEIESLKKRIRVLETAFAKLTVA